MRLKSFDNLLIGLMSFTAVICLYMLYGVRYFARDNKAELSIASIIDQVNTVKRKKDFYQSWMDVNSGDGLAQNDEIYTHGQSSAKIHFNNGPEVQLFENSLLRIKSNTVSLERGNLSAKLSPGAKKLDVLLNGKSYSFESSNANIQIEQGKTENKFLITDGDAKMKLGEKAEMLKPNQVLIQNKKSGEIKVKEIPFILSSPAQGFVSWFSKEKSVDFAWTFRGEATQVKFLLAKDSNFEKVLLTEQTSENHFTTTIKEGGNYFWKIVSQEDVSSPIRSLTLKEEKPLTLQLDKDILYKGPKANATVSLHWQRAEAKHYEMKIEEADKTNVVELDQNHYDHQASNIGETRFSVRVKEENRPEAIWSSTAVLKVLEAKSIQITSGLSDSLEKVNYTNKEFSQLLSWNGPSSGITYTIKVRHEGAEKIYKTDSISYPLQLTTAGDYEWNVQGETDSGVGTNTIGGKITVKVPLKISQSPSEGAVIELEKPDQTVAFKWDSSAGNEAVYAFELASDPNFQKTILSKESESNSLSTTVGQTGKYYWRVKIKKGDKAEYSAPVSVDIRPTPPLTRPEITPNLKIKMKLLEKETTSFHFMDFLIASAVADDEPVTVAEWDVPANPRAKTYIIEIYEDQNLSKLLTKIETTTPHVVWKKAKSGTFYWRMSYEDFWGRKTEFSKTATIETSIDEALIKKSEPEIIPPPPIELNKPKHREEILENAEDATEFTWDEISNVKTFLFQMARDLDFKEVVAEKKVKGEKFTLHCSDIEKKSAEGDLYWKVTADNGSTSKRRMVHTSCKEKKPEPEPAVVAPEVATETTPVAPKPKRLARVSFNPHHLSYSNKATNYSADVSGNVLNSWSGYYQNFADLKYFSMFSFDATVSRGKVFKTFTFTDMDINLRFHRVIENFHYGPVISISKKTLYEEENLAIQNKSASSPLVGIFAMKDFENVHALAEIKFAGAMDVYAEGLFHVKKNYSAGPFIHMTSMNKDAGKHQFTAFGVKFAYTFLFLDEAAR
jgi:hypothetical protein